VIEHDDYDFDLEKYVILYYYRQFAFQWIGDYRSWDFSNISLVVEDKSALALLCPGAVVEVNWGDRPSIKEQAKAVVKFREAEEKWKMHWRQQKILKSLKKSKNHNSNKDKDSSDQELVMSLNNSREEESRGNQGSSDDNSPTDDESNGDLDSMASSSSDGDDFVEGDGGDSDASYLSEGCCYMCEEVFTASIAV
jgi:hypothetical protein